MTTIIYRDTGKTRSPLTSDGAFVQFITQIAYRWQKWRSEREIESLPYDMRKDLGWPAAETTENPKAML